MRQSKLFTKVERNFPSDEVSANAKLLTRGGFVYKNSAGIYSYLPLGLRVIKRIQNIIREEINAIEGQELVMQTLVERKYLDATDRWNLDVGFEAKGKKEKESNFVLGWTHEKRHVYNIPFQFHVKPPRTDCCSNRVKNKFVTHF